MIYNDGYETDSNLRFLKCPKCGNEEYSEDAKYCRICGFYAYNECEGSPEYDNFGNVVDFNVHRNVGNARYCEFCGQQTTLLKEKMLKPYDETATNIGDDPTVLDDEDEDDDIPF